MVKTIEHHDMELPCPILEDGREATFTIKFYPQFNSTTDNKPYLSWIKKGAVSQYQFTMLFNCTSCNLCKPIRIDTANFYASKSQQRIINNNKYTTFSIGPAHIDSEGFSLYQRYIKARHPDNHDMNNISYDNFREKISTGDKLAKLKSNGKLVAFSLLKMDDKNIANEYTVFDPALSNRSLGTLMDLKIIEYATNHKIDFLYLGAINTESGKLKHKAQYSATEVFSRSTQSWHPIERNAKNLDHIP